MKYAAARPPRPCFFACSHEAGGRLLRSLIGAAAIALIATLLLSFVGSAPASSAERARLRGQVSVSADVVTLGDFFEDAGPLADRPLFRSPDLGTTGPVAAVRVVDLARAAGLAGADAAGLVEVSVTRLARPVEAAEIGRLIAAEAMRRPGRSEDTGVDDLDVLFEGPVDPRSADVRALEPVRVVSLTMNGQTGRFDALVQIDQGEKTDRIHLRGSIVETVSLTVASRNIPRGDIIAADDLHVERQPRNRLYGSRALVDPKDLVGRQARRALRAGQPVVAADFARPQIVARGELVTVVFRTAALRVTGRGQALQAGAVGDLVPVLNPQSKRTLHATVVSPGLVEIAAPATTLASVAKVEP
ncbi:MAG: flagellar basal body P-ring formation chaperone FlgA [Hyphomicrobiales bacterium]|nr:flagellar basal body P-ring formation chaperone FlgA [Hyphomicrobiales bacterium]